MPDDDNRAGAGPLGRRDLMKMSAGVMVTALTGLRTPALAPPPPSQVIPHTGTGWKNDANRASGNGPIDNTTRLIVEYVSAFSESKLTPPVVHALSRTMVDSMAALVAGFESEEARIAARLARTIHSDLQCTVLGYGITTSPEMAAFANGCMLRYADFNDLGPGSHCSDIISGILAVGESLHSTGRQTLVAIALGYEVLGALAEASPQPGNTCYSGGWDGPYEGPATTMAVGKLMGLTEDQLANALSLSLVPHMPMSVSHVGALSQWKSCHSSESIKSAVWAALLAREGMTGPCQPFEGRQGLFDHIGPFRSLRLPMSPERGMVVQLMGFKRTPTEGSSQAILEVIPQIRSWTSVDDIASIEHEMPFSGWQEIADPPKWDPRNRETADHSMPYLIARSLMDGEVYLDSFAPQKFMDPAVRRLMDKIIVRPHSEWTGNAPARITVRTKSGAERSWDSLGGRRNARAGDINTPMTDAEIDAKFARACAFMGVANDLRDRAHAQWSNLLAVGDIAEPMRTMAKFGAPAPL